MTHPSVIDLLAIGSAGFAGAITRFLVGYYAGEALGHPRFPVGTLVINITASFMLGAFVAYVDRRAVPLSGTLQLAIATGFIGTYSTFSTYMLETFRLAEKGAMALAAAYFVVSLVLGLAAVWAGMATVKALT